MFCTIPGGWFEKKKSAVEDKQYTLNHENIFSDTRICYENITYKPLAPTILNSKFSYSFKMVYTYIHKN